MKLARRIATAALSLFLGTFLLGATALMQAQDQREEPKPAQPDKQQDEKQPDNAKPPKENPKAKDNKDNKDKPAQNDDNRARQQDAKPTPQGGGEQAGQMAGQQGMSEQRGGQHGGRIPDDKFRASFGRQHTFTIQRPTVVSGQPTFQYGGYSFTMVDAWPAGWAYTDQCYIDYIDGEYFLFDLAHPGVRLAIVVVL